MPPLKGQPLLTRAVEKKGEVEKQEEGDETGAGTGTGTGAGSEAAASATVKREKEEALVITTSALVSIPR